jgi:NAD-dependent dihydropyrimidine dehydrogenase PreA subunit/nitroreductase
MRTVETFCANLRWVILKAVREKMVILENEKCVGCGLCEKICHHKCLQLAQGQNGYQIQVDRDLCSTCAQCVAICPTLALSWNSAAPQPFEKALLPSPSQVEELLKQRRTVRHFRGRPIDRGVLEEIAAVGGYAPTNHFGLRSIILDSPRVIRKLDLLSLKKIALYHNLVFKNQLTYKFLGLFAPSVNRIMRNKIQRSMDLGTTYESPPAAIIFVVGDQGPLLAAESAQFAIYNMILLAHAKGLGSRYLAAGPLFFDHSRKARSLIGLSNGERIFGSVELGIPAVKYRSKVAGKELPVSFVGSECHE